MMNDTFNIHRFFAYASKSYSENYKKYLAMAGLIAGLWILMMVWSDNEYTFQFAAILIAIIAGVVMVQMETKSARGRHTSAITGTLPCSQAERFLFTLLNTTVVLLAGTGVIAMTLTWLAIGMFHPPVFPKDGMHVMGGIPSALSLFVFFHGIALFATTTRIKNQLLAFVVTLFTAGALMMTPLLLPVIIDAFTGDFMMFYAFDTMANTIHSGTTSVGWMTQPLFPWYYGANGDMMGLQVVWDFFAWGAILWVAAYFNFRERQNA